MPGRRWRWRCTRWRPSACCGARAGRSSCTICPAGTRTGLGAHPAVAGQAARTGPSQSLRSAPARTSGIRPRQRAGRQPMTCSGPGQALAAAGATSARIARRAARPHRSAAAGMAWRDTADGPGDSAAAGIQPDGVRPDRRPGRQLPDPAADSAGPGVCGTGRARVRPRLAVACAAAGAARLAAAARVHSRPAALGRVPELRQGAGRGDRRLDGRRVRGARNAGALGAELPGHPVLHRRRPRVVVLAVHHHGWQPGRDQALASSPVRSGQSSRYRASTIRLTGQVRSVRSRRNAMMCSSVRLGPGLRLVLVVPGQPDQRGQLIQVVRYRAVGRIQAAPAGR